MDKEALHCLIVKQNCTETIRRVRNGVCGFYVERRYLWLFIVTLKQENANGITLKQCVAVCEYMCEYKWKNTEFSVSGF